MKVIISYPPLSGKGCPLLGQNRQFQWFHNPTYIYPVVPAIAATLLKQAGYEVIWNDAIAEGWDYRKYMRFLQDEKPDLIAIETKTPVINQHWAIIDDIKRIQPETKVILFGDHVTALPEESMLNSNVDYVVTGGDYDFLLLNLCNHFDKGVNLEPGIWYRANGEIKNTGKFVINRDLDNLPFIDRDLTKWKLYAYKNGNFKRTPGTYIMAGRDCWWRKDGGCKFCAWTVLYPQYRVRSVENVLGEVGQLIEKYNILEIMDDTGTFPAGKWLREFCIGMIEREYNKKIRFDCNLRFGILDYEDYKLMAKAGFRFLLYGLESANQRTIDLLNKGIKINQIEEELRVAKMANSEVGGSLEPHVTCMVGYPWETKEEAENTIEMTRSLFSKGLIDTLQATIVIPYSGSKLFEECEQNNWLKTRDWSRYDMREPVMITPMKDEEVLTLTKGIYKSFMTPKFLLRKMISVRSLDDFKFLLRSAKAVFGHLTDFSSR
jgi:radical SAM superfamily enzyme YgiQ (UPF0313 family)